MNYADALEAVVTRTGITRYRTLCADHNPRADQRDAYRALVIRLALGLPPEQPAHTDDVSPPPDPWLPLILTCPHYNPACCTNPAPWCSRFDLAPPRERCIDCLTADGIGPDYRVTTP